LFLSVLLVSLPAVGILLASGLWCADFRVQLCRGKMTGTTGYRFDENRSLILRGLSLFHGWLRFLMLYVVCAFVPTYFVVKKSIRPPSPP